MGIPRTSPARELAGAVAGARAGAGRVVVLEGFAGTGKTGVLLDFAASVAPDVTVRVATGHRDESDRRFGVLDGLAGAGLPSAAIEDRVEALLSTAEPTVLVLDDAQWADEDSLAVLARASRRCRMRSLSIVVATRPRPRDPHLIEIIGHSADVVSWIGELDRAAVAELLSAELPVGVVTDELVDRCHAATAGNPLLLREVVAQLHHGSEPVPIGGPWSAVSRFIARESAVAGDDGRVLAAVAVLREQVSPALLVAATGAAAAEVANTVDTFVDNGILDRSTLRFRHPLIAAAVLDDVNPGISTLLHDRSLDHLLAAHAAPDVVAAIAVGATPAGRVQVAIALRTEAERALTAGDAATAEQYLRRALTEPCADADVVSTRRRLAVAGVRARGSEALALFDDALASCTDDATALDVTLDHADALVALGRTVEALDALDDASERFRTLGSERDRVMAKRAVIGMDARLAPRVVPQVLALPVPDVPESIAMRELLSVRAYFELNAGDLGAAARHVAMSLSDPATFTELSPIARGLGVVAAVHTEQLALARSVSAVVAELAEERSDRASLSNACLLQSGVALASGQLEESEAAARRALALVEGSEVVKRVGAASTLALALAEQGRTSEAATVIAAHRVPSGDGPATALLQLDAAAAVVAARAGDHERVVDILERVAPAAVRSSPVPVRRELAAALARAGRTSEASELARAEHDEAERHPDLRRWRAAAARTLAAVDPSVDTGLVLKRAAALLEESPFALDRVAVLTDLGAHLRRQGQRVDARPYLREAVRLARECRAHPWVARASDELTATGERRPPVDLAGRRGLTVTERRVVSLAVAGSGNADIAAELSVSKKTVEMHLSSVYRKLGIASRNDLATALPEAL